MNDERLVDVGEHIVIISALNSSPNIRGRDRFFGVQAFDGRDEALPLLLGEIRPFVSPC